MLFFPLCMNTWELQQQLFDAQSSCWLSRSLCALFPTHLFKYSIYYLDLPYNSIQLSKASKGA